VAKLEGGVEAVNFGADFEPADEPKQGELIVDETRLTREQVLARYFKPKAEFTGEKLPDQIIEFPGVGELAVISPTSSFIMPQIRNVYDANHLEGIGSNIHTSLAGQLQNCAVALLSQDSIKQYIDDLNDYFETSIQLEEIPWHDDLSGYMVTIFGHNRQLGVAAHNRFATGHPDHGKQLFVKLIRDPQFWQVLEMQAVENTGMAPNMWERSRAIVRYKELRARDGIPATQEEIAGFFGVDSDQVWRAERYEALPNEIKELVVSEKLPYSGSFELDRLLGLYGREEVYSIAKSLAKKKASSKI
jgi:hypothetical protein